MDRGFLTRIPMGRDPHTHAPVHYAEAALGQNHYRASVSARAGFHHSLSSSAVNCCHAQSPLSSGTRMHASLRNLPVAIAIAFAGAASLTLAWSSAAIAQSTTLVRDMAACTTQNAEIERRMEVARSKGQMLLRRQLADQLATSQAGCKAVSAAQPRPPTMEMLEKEIQLLKAELNAAEEQLSKLKGEVSR